MNPMVDIVFLEQCTFSHSFKLTIMQVTVPMTVLQTEVSCHNMPDKNAGDARRNGYIALYLVANTMYLVGLVQCA